MPRNPFVKRKIVFNRIKKPCPFTWTTEGADHTHECFKKFEDHFGIHGCKHCDEDHR